MTQCRGLHRSRRIVATAVVATALAVIAGLAGAGTAAAAGGLRAGAGRADITPQTGYPLGGFVRADRAGQGQHTRLFATALVLERGSREVALVSLDLFASAGGLVKQAAQRAGFSERNVLVSATHTHGGPSGFANFETFNTIAPSVETIDDPDSFVDFLTPQPADPALYSFLVRQVSQAIKRAKRDSGPAVAGWGSRRLLGVTENRSLEAHLANHGIIERRGDGRVAQDPGGYAHTIDPAVNVLRVDKLVRGRRVPVGGWSTFANHGTVNPSEFEVYTQDHFGAATRVFERGVRRAGDVPRSQEVVNVYGNSDAGDQSAGLRDEGPAHAERVGSQEAKSMLSAWRSAGHDLSRRPELDLRWTRVCFCGQRTGRGRVASSPAVGLPFLTGSEEERGPLFDITRVPFEGRRNPVSQGEQGHKLGVSGIPSEDTVPKAVPLLALQVDDRMIVSFPGEPTAQVGRRLRSAVGRATGGSGVKRVVVSGYANEFLQYFTTPEEYDRQHYEGGSTLFGPLASVLVTEQLAELAGRLVDGRPAQRAYPFDPTNGVAPTGASFGPGAAQAATEAQPRRSYPRLGEAEFAWRGGPRGRDRPLDDPFVTVERRARGGWRTATTDLGLEIVWRVDDGGHYRASWEVPLDEPRDAHRVRITARRYELTSRPFSVTPSRALDVEQLPSSGSTVRVALGYPAARKLQDITFRPARVNGGTVRFEVGGETETVRRRRGSTFSVEARRGESVTIPRRGARDRFGNSSGGAVTLGTG